MARESREQSAEAASRGEVSSPGESSHDHRLWSGLARVGLFLMLVAVLAKGIELFNSAVLRGISTGEQGVWNAIVQGRINADVLVTGSSRALVHYDARMLEQELGRSTYNIGLNGSQTDMQVARFKTYLRNNRAPKLLIHNLDAFSLQVTHGEVYDPGQYLPFLDQEDIYGALLKINPETWKWRYLPLYGYATQDMRLSWLYSLLGLAIAERPDTHFLGYRPRYDEWTEDFERFRASNPDGIDVIVEERGVQQLEEMLSMCQSRGIRVVLVYSPEFTEMQAMTRNRAEIFSIFRRLSEEYGALFLDFSTSDISFSKSWFYNSQHLNARGAQEFTRELAKRLAALDTESAWPAVR